MSSDTDETRRTEETRQRLTLFQRLPIRRIVLIVLAIVLVLGVGLGTWSTLRVGRFTASGWGDLLINGIARGSVYALIAMGYTLVYGILFMINFAHGEVFMAGTFTTLFVARWLSEIGFLNSQPILSLAILLVCSALFSMVVAILLERIAYRPLRGAPRLVPLITAIGASLFLQYTFRGLYGAQAERFPTIEAVRGAWSFFGFSVAKTQVIVIIGAVLLVAALYVFIERTKTGRSMRAVGEDKEVASLMGIDVNRTIVTTFAIGGLLAGAAGILFILLFNQVIFDMGFIPGIKAFTAAVLGGIGNITGAALGGLALGVLEAVGPLLFLTGTNVPGINQLQPVVAFGVLVLVLIFRPGGILGSAEEGRA
jgi:branched-chain amino acid transport system permease protein